MTDFVVSAVQDAAQRAIEQDKVTAISIGVRGALEWGRSAHRETGRRPKRAPAAPRGCVRNPVSSDRRYHQRA